MQKPTIVLATHNAGKVAELADRLQDLGVEVVSAGEIEGAPDVVEDAETLRGNAEKKARALFEHTGLPSLADDTGLEVDALDGAPGVYSARFAGSDANDQLNRSKLLADIAERTDRRARFRTSLAYIDANGIEFFDGVCEGQITTEERGAAGFGYDSIFLPTEADGRTFAEMGKAEKNVISHRGRALSLFVEFLKTKTDLA